MRRPELNPALDTSPRTDHAAPAQLRLIGGSRLRPTLSTPRRAARVPFVRHRRDGWLPRLAHRVEPQTATSRQWPLQRRGIRCRLCIPKCPRPPSRARPCCSRCAVVCAQVRSPLGRKSVPPTRFRRQPKQRDGGIYANHPAGSRPWTCDGHPYVSDATNNLRAADVLEALRGKRGRPLDRRRLHAVGRMAVVKRVGVRDHLAIARPLRPWRPYPKDPRS